MAKLPYQVALICHCSSKKKDMIGWRTMAVKSYAHTERFCANLQRLFDQVRGSDLLKGMREKAFDHFLELGLPEKKQEDFQYVPLRLLYEGNYRLFAAQATFSVLPECRNSYLVFVGGQFHPELSDLSALPKGVVVLPILEAMRSYGTFLQNRWSKALREEADPLAVLNLACHPRGVFIYVPPKTSVEVPLQWIDLCDAGAASMPRLQLFLASQSKLSCISTVEGKGWTNSVVDVALEDGASFSHTAWNSSGDGWQTSALRATLKRDSQLQHFSVMGGGFCKRESFKILLSGENGCATLDGGWILSGKNQAHAHVVMEHAAPYCRSMQRFKGIVNDTSHSSFQGKILVRKEAQKTEAYQLNNNLVLSEHAIANCKPGLEIFADDVKASHGATVSQLDVDQLFYLKSRGIAENTAKKLLVHGFCRDLFEKIPLESLRQEILAYAQSIL
jgi:Fe-S cluster assembly protein SufD